MISQMDHISNETILHRVMEERNILHTIRWKKANWIGHILCRNCLLSHIIEGEIVGTRRLGRRHKQQGTGSLRRKLSSLFGELSLEEAMDLSQDRQLLDFW
jgi:hypothetical protein